MAFVKVEVSRDLPEGWTPIEVISVVKCLDEDGDVALATRTSQGLTPWECVGMLTAACDSARGQLQRLTQDQSED